MSESPALNMLALLQYFPSNIFPPTFHQQLNKKDGYTIGYGPQVKLAKNNTSDFKYNLLLDVSDSSEYLSDIETVLSDDLKLYDAKCVY